MHGDKKPEHMSSWLVHPGALLTWFIFFISAVIYNQLMLSAFFLVLFSITAFSRMWSIYSLKKIIIEIAVPKNRIFSGQEAEIYYCLQNRKFWPLIWVQLMHQFGEDCCLAPLNEDEILCIKVEQDKKQYFYTKRIAWVLWFNTVKWKSVWKGTRRGVYELSDAIVSSGDGFGLSAVEKKDTLSSSLIVVVYPALVPVDIRAFKSIWGDRRGEGWFVEDVTLIKSTRDYRPGDPWKHINWRLAALHKPLQVNVYEKVNHQPVHFYLDAISFTNNPDEFEDALSILTSVIVKLNERDIAVGLTLPSTGKKSQCNHYPGLDEDHVLNMLTSLAEISLNDCGSTTIAQQDLSIDNSSVQIYFITYNDDIFRSCSNIPEVFFKKVHAVLSYQYEGGLDEFYNGRNGPVIIPMKGLKL